MWADCKININWRNVIICVTSYSHSARLLGISTQVFNSELGKYMINVDNLKCNFSAEQKIWGLVEQKFQIEASVSHCIMTLLKKYANLWGHRSTYWSSLLFSACLKATRQLNSFCLNFWHIWPVFFINLVKFI